MAGVDPERVSGIIAEISEREIVSRYQKLESHEVEQKSGPNDLVTVVDHAVEDALERALKDVLPEASVIGEEGAAAEPDIVAALQSDGAYWVIDPLDGTRNFVRGVDEFGTIVALVRNGETIMGWIHGALERKTAVAVKGGGAFWDGEKLAPSGDEASPPKGLRSIGALSDSWRTRLSAQLKAGFQFAEGHCSAYAYLNIARGLLDFKISSLLHPWDHAAGVLLTMEAGGWAAFIDDDQVYRPCATLRRPLLATAPGRDWAEYAANMQG